MFDPQEAFSRTLGWLTAEEQDHLAGKRIAIAGLGGVGGNHLLMLSRLGIGGFHLADFDRFELVNFNRQAGAGISSLGKPKTQVMQAQALDINPKLSIKIFADGVTDDNLETFLDDVDFFIDGLDFFAMPARRAAFAACADRGIPAMTSAPLGWAASALLFASESMSFEDYFQLDDQSPGEQLCRFLVGLSPEMTQLAALVDPTHLDLKHQRGPSTTVGCWLSAALVATSCVKQLLGRGPIITAPTSIHLDTFHHGGRCIERPGGMSHPAMQQVLGQVRQRLQSTAAP